MGPLGGLLEASWSLLGASWGHLGRVRAKKGGSRISAAPLEPGPSTDDAQVRSLITERRGSIQRNKRLEKPSYPKREKKDEESEEEEEE